MSSFLLTSFTFVSGIGSMGCNGLASYFHKDRNQVSAKKCVAECRFRHLCHCHRRSFSFLFVCRLLYSSYELIL